MHYRAEIDGLRALAVVSVILFHGSLLGVRGGFVGVDVFFVISGYLITTIILQEKDKGHFSLVHFYERRARRILPALFLVMACCLVPAWLWLFPKDLKDFSQSLVAVTAFTSNLLFWHESGYWGTTAQLKPLLHTWSLAVEEQYYLLFPLFLMALWRFRRRWIFVAVALVAVLSLSLSEVAAHSLPMANFFLLPTRAWELAIGALIALFLLYGRGVEQLPFALREVAAIAGLALVLLTMAYFDEETPVPSLLALVPTVGTGLVILFGTNDTLIGKVLGWRPFVLVGLISYSAYLWHQPLFAFARHYSLTTPAPWVFACLGALSLVLAFISWRYIEKPFRDRKRFDRRQIFQLSALGMMVFAGIGIAGHLSNGKVGERAAETADKLVVARGLGQHCQDVAAVRCATSAQPEIVVWGDSLAMHLVDGILASKPDVRLAQFTMPMCGPFFDIAPVNSDYPPDWARGCLAFTDEVRKWLKQHPETQQVVISSSYGQYLGQARLMRRDGSVINTNFDIVQQALSRTLHELRAMGVEPVIVSRTPSPRWNQGHCTAKAAARGLPLGACNYSDSDVLPIVRKSHALIEPFASSYTVVWLDELLCPNGLCVTNLRGKWLYYDNAHFTAEGSRTLGKILDFYARITGHETPQKNRSVTVSQK